MNDVALEIAPEAAEARLELQPSWSVADDAYGWRHVASVFGSLIALIAVAPWAWLYISPLTVLVILPLLGASIYKLTIIMHDCCHFSLFKDKELNRKVGGICGLLLGSDFESFRKAHWKHHKEYGNEDDPQGRDYLGLQRSPRAHVLWHLFRPLLGYNLFKLGMFQAQPKPAARAAINFKPLIVMGVIQLALALLATGFGAVWWLFPLYPVAAATFVLFYSQTRGFCEHVAPPGTVGEAHVRSHLPHALDKALFYTLNFNYHVEHHFYPQVPSCHLPAVAKGLAAIGKSYPHSPSILSTIRTRLAQCPN